MAMGGTGYALSLPKASVGAKQLKKGAVNSKKVKNASLLETDFKAGQLPAGPRAPPVPPAHGEQPERPARPRPTRT